MEGGETGEGEKFRKIEAEGAADGQRSWTKHVSGLVSNMLRCGLKYLRKLALKGMQMGIILGERGVVVGGQRSCTKHASGLV